LLAAHAQLLGPVRVGQHQVGRVGQVPGGHEVGVHVVVGDGRVLVRTGHPVEVELAVPVVVAQRAPQPGRLHHELQPDVAGEVLVAGRVQVPHGGVGDVGPDVERGGTG